MYIDSKARFVKSYPRLDFVDQDMMRVHPENGSILPSLRLQPVYNPKARYLPISQKYPFRKHLIISALQKSQNLATETM